MGDSFDEPMTLLALDRSWQDRREQLRFERSEYRGRPVFALRCYWQNGEGAWRWVPAKPSQSGRCWQALSLKARELAALGQALIQAASELEQQSSPGGEQQTPQREQRTPRRPSPAQQRELDAADAWPAPAVDNDEDLPF